MTKAAKSKPAAILQPIALDPNGAVMAAIVRSMQTDGVRSAVQAFIEGRGLEGTWNLGLVGATLFPVQSEPLKSAT